MLTTKDTKVFPKVLEGNNSSFLILHFSLKLCDCYTTFLNFTCQYYDLKHLYLFGLLLSLPFFGFSQGEFNKWYFGINVGLDFNSGIPVETPNPNIVSGSASVSVSDSLGNLLFYAGDWAVFNRNHDIMPNGLYLNTIGGAYDHQPALAVRQLSDDSSYYLFNIGEYIYPLFGIPLNYSVIDMRLNGGLGDITVGQKNIPVPGAENSSSALTGTRHKNNHDVWIVVRNYKRNGSENQYAAYLINSMGINLAPVYSQSNVPMYWAPLSYYCIMIRISPDGKKLVSTYMSQDGNKKSLFEFCNFNSSTGVITPLFTIDLPLYGGIKNDPTSIEFSRDSKNMYLASSVGGNAPCQYYQYDATQIDSALFKQSEVFLGSATEVQTGIQRGPDDKIYCSRRYTDSLDVIENPMVGGLGCNFQKGGVALIPGAYAGSGFPQFIQRYYVYLHSAGQCAGKSIGFSATVWPLADSLHWDFGDPASGVNNFSNLSSPIHSYSNPGSYQVMLIVRHNDNRMDTGWQTITILDGPHPALGQDRSICIGDSVMLDAGYWMNSTYAWDNLTLGLMNIASTQIYYAKTTGEYRVTVTNSDGCQGKDTVNITLNPIPDVTNSPLTKSICSGESTNIALTSTVPGTNFHWTANLTSGTITGFSADSGLVINQVLTNSLSTPGIVTYHVTPKIGSCSGSTVDFPVTVNPGDSVKVSISASINNICSGTQITFTANPTNPGLTPVYHWKVNGINSGTNSSTFSYTPLNTDVVTCALTSSLTVCISNNPATSNGIIMVVNPNLPVSVTVTPSQNPVCAGTSVTFTANPFNGGTTPSYQWKVNGTAVGANLSTYSYIPLNGDGITCTVNSNATCAVNNPFTSAPVTMTVNPNMPVSVSITSSSNPFCAGSSVTFTATPNNGGTPPSYQWKVNGIGVGPDNQVYSYFPNNGDVVTCVLNSNIACPIGNPATSNAITMIVNSNLPAGVSITATSNPFCPGSSVTFTATPSNGGSTPAYQWEVNGNNVGINSSTYTYNPVNNDSVRCIMTSNLACVTGNPASSAKIIMSGTLAPVVTFTSCFDTITTINAKPIKLKGGIPLGGTYSGSGVNSITSVFTPSVAGTGIKTITYSYTNAALCSASKSRNIIVQTTAVFTCGNNLTDIRDNKIYSTVQIGSQCWLATNLNYGAILASSQDQRDNCLAEKYCYNDNPVNCTIHGGLYQWDELMLFDETPADQGFCPPGWHIPTENDWNILFASYINNGFAGSPLKYSGYSGFNALLSGARHINRGWDFQGFATFFWSSTQISNTKAWAYGMNDADPSVSIYPASRVNAFSVRCLKD